MLLSFSNLIPYIFNLIYQQKNKRKVSLITFTTYVLSDDEHILTPTRAFVCLTLFDMIRMPLALLPMLIVFIIEVNFQSSESLALTIQAIFSLWLWGMRNLCASTTVWSLLCVSHSGNK